MTTKNGSNGVIDGPTSTVFKLTRIVGAMMAPRSVRTLGIDGAVITASKIAPSFMKFVQLHDDADVNAKGWNPDGSTGTFIIEDTSITAESVLAFSTVNADLDDICNAMSLLPVVQKFGIDCNNPDDGDMLNYVLINRP